MIFQIVKDLVSELSVINQTTDNICFKYDIVYSLINKERVLIQPVISQFLISIIDSWIIRKITLECEQTGATFFEVLKKHTDVYEKITAQLKKLGVKDAETFFENPARYRGLAAEKSRRLAEKYAELMKKL